MEAFNQENKMIFQANSAPANANNDAAQMLQQYSQVSSSPEKQVNLQVLTSDKIIPMQKQASNCGGIQVTSLEHHFNNYNANHEESSSSSAAKKPKKQK